MKGMVTQEMIQIINNKNILKTEEALKIISKFEAEYLKLDEDKLYEGYQERECLGNTAIGSGFATPHAIIDHVKGSYVFLHIFENGVDWDAYDCEKVKVVFGIVVNKNEHDNRHLRKIAAIAKSLMDEEFQTVLLTERDKEKLVNKINMVGDEL